MPVRIVLIDWHNSGQLAVGDVGFPLYNPDLAPCDYQWLGPLKKHLEGKKLQTDGSTPDRCSAMSTRSIHFVLITYVKEQKLQANYKSIHFYNTRHMLAKYEQTCHHVKFVSISYNI